MDKAVESVAFRERPFIDGAYAGDTGGKPLTVCSPWTNETIATVVPLAADHGDL